MVNQPENINYLGNVELIKHLGSGTYGVVYSGIQRLAEGITRDVAVKILKPNLFSTKGLRAEGLGATLEHTNIITIYDIFDLPIRSNPDPPQFLMNAMTPEGDFICKKENAHSIDQCLKLKDPVYSHDSEKIAAESINYTIMEYCPDGDMTNLERKNISPDEKLKLMDGVLQGLKALHENEIIHRDIKPENVLIGPNKTPKLTDFGVATRMSREGLAGTYVGTPLYMAPEVNLDTDTQYNKNVDLFAVGLILYSLLRSEKDPDLKTLKKAIMENESLDDIIPGVPSRYRPVISKALRLNPRNRFQSADEMIRALAEATKELDLSSQAKPVSQLWTPRQPSMTGTTSIDSGSSRDRASIKTVQCKTCGETNFANNPFCTDCGTPVSGNPPEPPNSTEEDWGSRVDYFYLHLFLYITISLIMIIVDVFVGPEEWPAPLNWSAFIAFFWVFLLYFHALFIRFGDKKKRGELGGKAPLYWLLIPLFIGLALIAGCVEDTTSEKLSENSANLGITPVNPTDPTPPLKPAADGIPELDINVFFKHEKEESYSINVPRGSTVTVLADMKSTIPVSGNLKVEILSDVYMGSDEIINSCTVDVNINESLDRYTICSFTASELTSDDSIKNYYLKIYWNDEAQYDESDSEERIYTVTTVESNIVETQTITSATATPKSNTAQTPAQQKTISIAVPESSSVATGQAFPTPVPIATIIPVAENTPTPTPLPPFENVVEVISNNTETHDLNNPVRVIADQDGIIYVFDSINNVEEEYNQRVKIFDADERFITSLPIPVGHEVGHSSIYDSQPISIDQQGRIHSNNFIMNRDGTIFSLTSNNPNIEGTPFKFSSEQISTSGNNDKVKSCSNRGQQWDIKKFPDNMFLHVTIEPSNNGLSAHFCRFNIDDSVAASRNPSVQLLFDTNEPLEKSFSEYQSIYSGLSDKFPDWSTQYRVTQFKISENSLYALLDFDGFPYSILYSWDINDFIDKSESQWPSDIQGNLVAITDYSGHLDIGYNGNLYIIDRENNSKVQVVDSATKKLSEFRKSHVTDYIPRGNTLKHSTYKDSIMLSGSSEIAIFEGTGESIAIRKSIDTEMLEVLTSKGDIIFLADRYGYEGKFIFSKHIDNIFGQPKWIVGGKGTLPGTFINPLRLWKGHKSNNIYVWDTDNIFSKIHIFDTNDGSTRGVWDLNLSTDSSWNNTDRQGNQTGPPKVCDLEGHEDGSATLMLSSRYVSSIYRLFIIKLDSMGIITETFTLPPDISERSDLYCDNTTLSVDHNENLYFADLHTVHQLAHPDPYSIPQTLEIASSTGGFEHIRDVEFDDQGFMWVLDNGPRAIKLSR